MKKFIKLDEERVPIDNISSYTGLGYIKNIDKYEILVSFYDREEFSILYDDDASYREGLLNIDRVLLI